MAVVFAWPDPSLEFEIDGSRGQTNHVIVAGESTRNFDFSDSTTIALAPGGRVIIDELRSNGASVVLADVNEPAGREQAKRLHASFVAADLSQRAGCRRP